MPSNNRHSPANWKKVEIGYNYGRNETTKKNPQCVCVCLTLIYIHIYTRDKGCANLPGRITIGTSPTGETTKLISGYKDDRKVPCCILWMNSWNDFDSGGNVDLFAARIRSSSNDRIPDMLLVLILSGLMWLCFVLCRFLFKIAPLSVSFFFKLFSTFVGFAVLSFCGDIVTYLDGIFYIFLSFPDTFISTQFWCQLPIFIEWIAALLVALLVHPTTHRTFLWIF